MPIGITMHTCEKYFVGLSKCPEVVEINLNGSIVFANGLNDAYLA